MIKASFERGVRDASKRFGVKESSSLFDLILAGLTPKAVSAGLRVMTPNLMPSIEKSLEVPFRAARGAGSGILRAMRGPTNPAEALSRGLARAPMTAGIRDPGAWISKMETV